MFGAIASSQMIRRQRLQRERERARQRARVAERDRRRRREAAHLRRRRQQHERGAGAGGVVHAYGPGGPLIGPPVPELAHGAGRGSVFSPEEEEMAQLLFAEMMRRRRIDVVAAAIAHGGGGHGARAGGTAGRVGAPLAAPRTASDLDRLDLLEQELQRLLLMDGGGLASQFVDGEEQGDVELQRYRQVRRRQHDANDGEGADEDGVWGGAGGEAEEGDEEDDDALEHELAELERALRTETEPPTTPSFNIVPEVALTPRSRLPVAASVPVACVIDEGATTGSSGALAVGIPLAKIAARDAPRTRPSGRRRTRHASHGARASGSTMCAVQ